MPSRNFEQSEPHKQKLSKNLSAIRKIWVGDVMHRDPIVVDVREKIEVAAGLLSDNNIRHLPVIDSDGNLQGIISDRDLLGAVLNTRPWVLQERLDTQRSHHRVREFMSTSPETITPDMDLLEAGSLMLENKISCLPVVEGNRVVGIITATDFVKLVCEGFEGSPS
jgi:CBS domain-containing membrane protein